VIDDNENELEGMIERMRKRRRHNEDEAFNS